MEPQLIERLSRQVNTRLLTCTGNPERAAKRGKTMVMNASRAWIRDSGRNLHQRRQPEYVQGVSQLPDEHPSMSFSHGLSRREFAIGLGGLGLLLAGARMVPSAAAQGSQLQQCGGNSGIEVMLAYSQGTMIPRTLLAADPRWPAYINPISPTISFRYPPGWQPVDLPAATPGVVLYAPQGNALVAMGSSQSQAYIPMDDLLAIAMQTVFVQFLRQPVGQSLCVYPLSRSALHEYDFAAAQNRTTLAAVSVTAAYSEGVTLDANSNLVPTISTISIYYAVAGPSDQFAALAETVFFPILGQLLMTGGGADDADDDEDDTDEDGDDWG